MKHTLLLFGLVSMLLAAGCSKPENKPVNHSDRTTKTQLPTIGKPPDAGGVPPPPGQLAPAGRSQAAGATAAKAAVTLVRDSEQADELADYSEKVYIQWNEALKQFRSKERRPPGSLLELQKSQPKLASLPAPKGFQLDLDPQLGEINVVRATSASRR